jgi:transcriptional regulator with XRE-family HTH domain
VKDKSINKRIGEQIRMIRLGKSMSLEAVSDELKISVSTLSNLERGETEMTVSRLFEMLNNYKFDILTFIQNLQSNTVVNNISSDSFNINYQENDSKLNRLEDEINQLKIEMLKLKDK